jgi:hypothetical protein
LRHKGRAPDADLIRLATGRRSLGAIGAGKDEEEQWQDEEPARNATVLSLQEFAASLSTKTPPVSMLQTRRRYHLFHQFNHLASSRPPTAAGV